MFEKYLSRRSFLGRTVKTGIGMTAGLPWLSKLPNDTTHGSTEPLHDWTLWEKYRSNVQHPSLTIKSEDLNRAKENIQKYEWAQNYVQNIKRQADHFIELIARQDLDQLIELTTPGDPLWTPCPSCREKGLPFHPHGQWEWTIQDPDQLVCEVCRETFPHAEYPEDMVIKTSWGIPQTITYYGGEPFLIFGFEKGRPSFSANIRSRKVQWCADACRVIAEVYLLTEEQEYAVQCKAILTRFATCYPNWLVHVGYGEYADMDPRIASRRILDLPEREITPPPNMPDYKLWTGYWSAGRASGVGLESDFVRKVVESYDFTCEAKTENQNSVYSTEERIRIEKDLLLESTLLLVCDEQINNKSVSNRTAVGMVGICVGHPGLMRFGLEGFDKTVKEWFLEDGTTKETPFYGLMTLGGIWNFAQSVRGYSDPENYRDSSGKRLNALNLYQDRSFSNVWAAFFNGLQGDLNYPPYADSFHNTSLDTSYVELMVANYEDQPEYLALLKERCGENLEKPSGPVPERYFQKDMENMDLVSLKLPYDLVRPQSSSSFALYYRDTELFRRSSGPLHFLDWNPKTLRIGHVRSGQLGREGLLLLNASHWRGHNHMDSLNLHYWKNGKEVLSDLGYLWDHPEKQMTTRTLAHNTVLIDEKDQVTNDRGGEMSYFQTSDHVKMMEAKSDAYPEAQLYRRTVVQLDHGNGRNYIVDFFRVQGGETQDYVFHMDTLDYQVSDPDDWSSSETTLYDFHKTEEKASLSPWRVEWPVGDKMKAQGWMISQEDETSYISEGWGQKDWENLDVGARATYIVRRCKGDELKTFIAVYEGSDADDFFVKNVFYDPEQNLLSIETSEGMDYVVSALGDNVSRFSTDAGTLTYNGHFASVSIQDGKRKWEFLVE